MMVKGTPTWQKIIKTPAVAAAAAAEQGVGTSKEAQQLHPKQHE